MKKLILLLTAFGLITLTKADSNDVNAKLAAKQNQRIVPAHIQQNLPTLRGGTVTNDCGTQSQFYLSLSVPQDDSLGVTQNLNVSGITGTLGTDVFLSKVHVMGNHTWVGDL